MDAKNLRETLSGAELTLQDEDAVERYCFHANGAVTATLGTRGGPVCGPVLRYVVTDDAKVQISDSHAVFFTWEQVELSDDIVTVKCGQRVKRFTYTPGKKRERYLP